jgi:hypothetical protein
MRLANPGLHWRANDKEIILISCNAKAFVRRTEMMT